jgi:hypothetical protein
MPRYVHRTPRGASGRSYLPGENMRSGPALVNDGAPRRSVGQGRPWPTGGWHSRSTPSSGNTRAFRHLRFVSEAVLPLPGLYKFLRRATFQAKVQATKDDTKEKATAPNIRKSGRGSLSHTNAAKQRKAGVTQACVAI